MKDIIEIYKSNGALLNGHFLLSSGLHSDSYLQSERVMQYPETASKVVSGLVDKLSSLDFSTVVSPAIGGIRFGYELARQMSKRSLFTERVDGLMEFRRGFDLKAGERVIIAEDVVTTGKSTKECIDAVVKNGGVVVAVVSIIDRSSGKAEFGVPFIPLAAVEVKSYEASSCPLCASGVQLVKPGSRVFNK